jgi:hypothetical protein
LDTLIQFTAAVGPIALAIMGVVVSLKPPRTGRGRVFWAVAFAVVVVPAALAVFWELRGTDETLAKIWERVGAVPRGPRLEFAGLKKSDADGDAVFSIQFSNSSEVDATAYRISGALVPTEKDDSDLKKAFTDIQIERAFLDSKHDILNNIPLSLGGPPLSRGMGIGLPNLKLPKNDVRLISDGTYTLYVLALAAYVGKDAAPDHLWVTEVCAKVLRPFDTFQPCDDHNGYFYTDQKLSDVR